MGFETGLVLTALLLFLKTSSVYCQMRVDCLSQPFTSSQFLPSGPALLQATPQLVAPNLVKQIVRPLDNYIQDLAPIVPSFACIPGLAPGMHPMPPIIIDSSDNDDDWQNLLYLLILAMKNKNDGGWDNGCYNGCCNCCGGCCNCCGGSCSCCNGCGNYCGTCSSGCCNCGGNPCITYVPYPVPVPMPSGSYCRFGSSDNSGGVASDDESQNEINVIIKTDSTS